MSATPLLTRHEITWRVKIALFLAFAPLVNLLVSIALHWPLPTFPFWNITGRDSPEYVIFMGNRAENLPGSIMFAITCFTLGWLVIVHLVHDRGTFPRVFHDLGQALRDDIARIFTPESWMRSSPRKTDRING